MDWKPSFFAFAILAAVTCAEIQAAEPAAAFQPASPVRGEGVYARNCAACHGGKGDGLGPAAPYLKPLPRDFTAGMYKFRSTPSGELPTDSDLLRIVNEGIPGTQMPGWKSLLTPQERLDVVAYIKIFSPDFKDGAPPPLSIAEPPPAGEEVLREGRFLYMLMECWACHGGQGKGNGQSAKTLKDDWGEKIRPWDLTRPSYKGGRDPQSIYRSISTGLNGTPMPAYADDGFLVPGDAALDPEKFKEAYAEAEIISLQAWLRGQPSESSLGNLPEDKRSQLAESRKWALAHYVGSLSRRPNFLVRLFTENTEETP